MIYNKKNIIGAIVVVVIVMLFGVFLFDLTAVNADATAPSVVFQVNEGEGFRQIAQDLSGAHLIRSVWAFDFFALLDGRASDLKAGLYRITPSMDTAQVIALLSGAGAGEVTVTIPEGSNIYDIDRILSSALVIHPGALINFTAQGNLEGHLFPDTYQFYTNANVKNVVQEMLEDFTLKAQPLFVQNSANPANNPANSQIEAKDLIIASILEKEVPDQADQEVVAGIIFKRLAMGIPLDIDATVCYAKFQANPTSSQGCYPLTPLDFKIDSPYNTYLYKGLPPGPIGNPGISAITAALNPQSSSYLYYLSDPKTGKTIFAKTLDEQNQNKVKYLESN